MSKEEWEPKTSDCFLVTGGQMKRLRDEDSFEKRKSMLKCLRRQRYRSEVEKKEQESTSSREE